MPKKCHNLLFTSLILPRFFGVFPLLFGMVLLCHSGFSNVVSIVGPALETSGPELFWDVTEATPEVEIDEVQNENDSSSSEIQELLAAERQRATHFLQRLEIENSFVARLAVKLPIIIEEVTEPVEEPQETVLEPVDAVVEKVEKMEKFEEPTSEVDRLPLSNLTADSKLMKRAKVSFDDKTETWLAVWKKPAVFHFGMILHPELLDQVQDGEKLHFESKGMKLALLRSDNDKLLVEQTNGRRHELGAKRLEGLLRRSISVDGLELFLDAGGNLVLKAAGEQARSLASRTGRS